MIAILIGVWLRDGRDLILQLLVSLPIFLSLSRFRHDRYVIYTVSECYACLSWFPMYKIQIQTA